MVFTVRDLNSSDRRWIPRYLNVGPVSLPYVGRDKAIATICRSFADRAQICVAFCNSNTMLMAFRSERYAKSLSRFLLLNDGIGVDLCSWLFNGTAFEANLNGTDFVPQLLAASGNDRSVYLLGTTQDVLEKSKERLEARFPNCRFVGAHHGYFSPNEIDLVIQKINAVSPDILLVGLGNPLQEEFIANNVAQIDARVLIGVGAFLDFSAGKVPRAPQFIRNLRAKWGFQLSIKLRCVWGVATRWT